jgi:hypothetical protein
MTDAVNVSIMQRPAFLGILFCAVRAAWRRPADGITVFVGVIVDTAAAEVVPVVGGLRRCFAQNGDVVTGAPPYLLDRP